MTATCVREKITILVAAVATYVRRVPNPMEKLLQIKNFFQRAPFEWAVCGGVAIDRFLGVNTREHKDIDVAVFWGDRNKIIDFMLDAGWRVFEFCGNGVVHELFDSAQPLVWRNLFCFTSDNTNCQMSSIGMDDTYRFTFVPTKQKGFNYVEFLFNRRDEDSFVYHWNHSITLPLDKSILKVDGVPILCPEIVLLYKSTYADSMDRESDHSQDFQVTLPFLNMEQRTWLKAAIESEHSKNHPWVLQISETR